MKCEYMLCVYYNNNTCMLDNITINNIGLCDSCIVVNLPEEYVAKEREAVLKRLEAQYKAWETADNILLENCE